MDAPRCGIWCIGLCALLLAGSANAQEAGARVVIGGGEVNDDLYAAGERVQVRSAVRGDVVAAGGEILVTGPVTGDVLVAGGEIDIRGDVQDDVRAAGGRITIEGRVGDEVVAAGGAVRIEPGAAVGGRAWLAGGEVTIAGTVGTDSRIAGREVVIGGEVRGNLNVMAESVKLLPGARIAGDFSYRSPRQADISPEAQVIGTIIYRPAPEERGGRLAGALVFLVLSLLVSGIVLFLLFPLFMSAAARNIRTSPWKSLGLGLLLLIVTPLAVTFLMATLVGIPLALIMLAAYFIALLASVIVGMLFVGNLGLDLIRKAPASSAGRGIVALVLGATLLLLVQWIPFVGGLVWLLFLLLGFGALALQSHRVRSVEALG